METAAPVGAGNGGKIGKASSNSRRERYSTASLAAMGGAACTTPQIAAITGHSLKTVTSILDKYLARTRVLAGEAVTLFENAKSTKFANRLQTRTPKLTKGVTK